ncbi:hypothetical protein FDECE_16421 [Fusarium decemcellulare]|nr:hypothetical protein FDECE_16421 [Fusarium decemcellulare]
MHLPLRWSLRKHRNPIGVNSDSTEASVNGLGPSNGPAVASSTTQVREDTPSTDDFGSLDSNGENGPPCGIREIVQQSRDDLNCVDIIAIHGLNGHRDKTWIDKTSGINWLEHESCLRKDIPHARILTFGYNSRTYFSRSTSDVRDFSTELLAAITTCRKTLAEQQRPIVFLCHSLGGLVFKQAVIHAHEYNYYYSTLLDHILGVVFFATPHRGSDLAFWDEIGTKLVQIGTFGHSTNTKLSKDLKVDGSLMKRISDSFSHRGRKLKITCFYETERMKGLHCEVVTRESAILGWPNELAIATSAHHSNICKFSSPSDQRYRNTVSIIHGMIEKKSEEGRLLTSDPMQPQPQQQVTFGRREVECLRELNSDYDGHLGQVEDPVSGTCEWILSHEKWHRWDSLRQSALLWITADAGCGKSVIAKFLAYHFLSREETRREKHVCYFFFKEGLKN